MYSLNRVLAGKKDLTYEKRVLAEDIANAEQKHTASNFAPKGNFLSSICFSIENAQIVYNPIDDAHLTVAYDVPNASGYMNLYVVNQKEPAKIGNMAASLDGTYKIKVLDSQNHVVGDAYYNPPGFAETNLANVGFTQANRIRVVAAPKNGCVFSDKKEYSFKIVPVKVWKIAQTCERSWLA